MAIQPSASFPRVQTSSPLAMVEEIPDGRKKSPAVRVLVVDDEPLVLWSITETLRSHGMEVDEACTAKEALRAITAEGGPPDAVLLDLNLPDSHDLGLLRTVRTIAPATRVFLMTAFGTPEVRIDARQLGVVDVIDKPFDLTKLDEILTCQH